MKIVFAKHLDSQKEYLFETTIPVIKGDLIEVETIKGNAVAEATTGSIFIDNVHAMDLLKRLGATTIPLKPVIGRISPKLFSFVGNEVEKILNNSADKESELKVYFGLLPF